MICTLEIYIKDQWIKAANFEVRPQTEIDKGYRGSGFLTYDEDYTAEHLNERGINAISCRYLVNYQLYDGEAWPSFLLDLLPSGAGRRHWLSKLAIQDGPKSDWTLLLKGAGNAPGNLRIAEAVLPLPPTPHAGFEYADIITRQEKFIEYAQTHGAPVAGSTGAQGDAPKFLLSEDHHGHWHADGALADSLTARHWLVKFPRGKEASDRRILRNEAAYAKVAKTMGLRVFGDFKFDNNVLFVPRFDREVTRNQVIRHGQETLCSLAGVSEFSVRIPQERLCEVIAEYSSNKEADIKEFVLRDVLNVAMGNTDNHARNTSMSKYPDGRVTLSPLYDFAPMILDDQGIARVCRWTDVEDSGMPDWGRVADKLGPLGIDSKKLRAELRTFGAKVRALPQIMTQQGVDPDLIKQLKMHVKELADKLEKTC